MIVVSVGTNEARFDRLLTWVSGLATGERLVVQHGPSAVRPPGASCVDFLPFEDLVDLVRRSRAFVTHAGVGSIMVSLSAGRHPIVVARQRRFGEAVDDHQVALADRLAAEGMVTVARSAADLVDALQGDSPGVSPERGSSVLADELRAYLVGLCRPSA
jgi:UDP-N-acetylglucosamine transferase subunit ALG13